MRCQRSAVFAASLHRSRRNSAGSPGAPFQRPNAGRLDTNAAALLIKPPMKVRNGVLGHIVLNVADLKKSEEFYRSILGLRVSARNRETKMSFLSYGREHHDIALQALPEGAKHTSGDGVPKLHHFCIYVESNDIIDKIEPVLKRRKVPIVSGPETLVVAGNRSISFLDPDGNRVEIACNANKFRFDNRQQSTFRKKG
jgi:catechol 2,3-dioxygenase-like lactoylglutathione lyase family enzyme